MAFPPGYLAGHPLPPGIIGALALNGYGLLADLGGVGAGRLGHQAFLLLAPDPDPALPDAGTQLALHHTRLRDDAEAAGFAALANELGLARLTGYRLAAERQGLRSRLHVVDPATGAVRLTVPDQHPVGLLSRSSASGAARLLAAVRTLPPAGPAPDPQDPELLRGVLLALALRDDELTGAGAVELADRAVGLMRADPGLDPPAALESARALPPGT
jgi:hypothetical protein